MYPAYREVVDTLEHLIMECEFLDYIRIPIIGKIKHIIKADSLLSWDDLSSQTRIQIIMDITKIRKEMKITKETLGCIEYESRRLLYLIHIARFKLMSNN